ncbi:MAG: thiamine diphosphokinase [Chloroflexi bacterium]|nr:MAG: thiamine diphosphokinase [Chloroflexota bacterium]
MITLIFANGEMAIGEWIRPYLQQATAVIAADGGTRHLHKLGKLPDLAIGDLDSLTDDLHQWLNDGQVTIQQHPPAKDETDLELALIHAATEYSGPIYLFGVLGGRLDQTLANILLLTHPILAKRVVKLVTANETAWLVTQSTKIIGNPGDIVSLIPLGGDVNIDQTTGLEWPLESEVLAFGLARGISNVMTASTASVAIKDGTLLCIHTPATVR